MADPRGLASSCRVSFYVSYTVQESRNGSRSKSVHRDDDRAHHYVSFFTISRLSLTSSNRVFEAGFFPGAVYLLSTWYTRYEVQKRYTIFYGVGCVAGALSGIMAYGISKMEGDAGLRGWRWIFIIEGTISCVGALTSFVFLVGFPEDSHLSWNFLSFEERNFVIRRVNRDREDAETEPFSFAAFLSPAADFKIWVFAFMFFCVTTVGYSINYFLPIILVGLGTCIYSPSFPHLPATSASYRRIPVLMRNPSQLGFSVAQSQCLIVPPWAFTGLYMYAQAWLSDRYRLRGPFIALNAIVAIVGLVLMAYHPSNGVRYFGTFLVVAGASGNTPPVLAYQANNIRGHWKRAFCSATLVGAGGIGGIAGALVFRSQDMPRYLPGIYASLTCNFCILVCTAGLSVWFYYQNKKAREGTVVLEGLAKFLYTL